ncbi:MAG: glycosyltransferase family 4 protein [Flavobacteriales bacterium]|nr:glycosyltransferase family 4 protein [Flavobacteriales bacterium]
MGVNDRSIGFFCSSISWGGLEMNLLKYAQWLHERGWRVVLFCVKNTPIDQSHEGMAFAKCHIGRNHKYFDFKNARRAARMFDHYELEYVWITDTRDMDTAGIACRRSAISPTLVYQQAMQLGVKKKDWIHTMRYRRIDIWIALLPYLRRQLHDLTRIDMNKVVEIPLGVDLKSLEYQGTREQAQLTFRLPSGTTAIGVIGRFDKLKGQLFVIKAMAKLVEQGLPVHLLIVGESTRNEANTYEQNMREAVAALGLTQHVTIHPFIQDVERFYKAVDILAVPSAGETFGMVTIEGMACGCAVIGTDTSGTPEILDHGGCGLLYEPDNLNQFVDLCSTLVTHPDKRHELSYKATERVHEMYDINNVLDRIQEELVSRRKR